MPNVKENGGFESIVLVNKADGYTEYDPYDHESVVVVRGRGCADRKEADLGDRQVEPELPEADSLNIKITVEE